MKAAAAGNATVRRFADGSGGWFVVKDEESGKSFGLPFETTAERLAGSYVLQATINAPAKDAPFTTAALRMMEAARVVARVGNAKMIVPVELAIPMEPWSLRFDVPWEMDLEPPSPDGSGLRLAGKTASGVMMTAFLDRNDPVGTAAQRRDFIAEFPRSLPARMKPKVVKVNGLRTWDEAGKSFLAYDVEAEGVPGVHRSQNVVLVRDGWWIDVHVSQSPASPESQALVDALVASVRMAD